VHGHAWGSRRSAPPAPYGGIDPTIPLRAAPTPQFFGPDWGQINRAQESALRQRTCRPAIFQNSVIGGFFDSASRQCHILPMPPATLTRNQKRLIRTYALDRERLHGNDVIRVRLLSSGDARAYCADGYTYLIDPIPVLLAEAERVRRIVPCDA
jgi:hypothetical protein